MNLKLRGVACALLLFPIVSAAQNADPEERPHLAASFAEGEIAIDGRLDEPAWRAAEKATRFRQFQPLEGAPATQPTEVQILYGTNSIYIGALLRDDDPDRIQRTLGRRDEYMQADWFAVSIDSHLDRRTAYVFGVNAGGVEYDALRTEGDSGRGPGGGGDASWNAIWDSDVRVTSEGWTVEMEIPYSMLRFSRAAEQVWGIHFSREIPRLGEESEWPHVPRTERTNFVARFGHIYGISGVEPRQNVEITPYTLSRLQTEEDPARAGRLEGHAGFDAGADLKLGLGSDVTLNATINPDFGQVESDPAELNLTAFETFFPEKRPFFVEGTQIFGFPLIGRGSLLYTRRIGADAPVIGAAKVSGRTSKGLSFGVLGAATGENFDPGRNYGVARASQQIGAFSSAGGMLTAFDGPGFGRKRNRVLTGGADWDLRFRDNAYGLSGFAAFMHRFGATTGLTGQILAARRRGAWTYEFGGDFVDHRFDPNDLGRQQRNNAAGAVVRFEHNVNAGRPFGPFQRAEIEGSAWHQWSYLERINLGGQFGVESNWTLHSFESVEFGIEVNNLFGGYDQFETRGLWPSAVPAAVEFAAEYETDERREWQIEPGIRFTTESDGGLTYDVGARGRWNVKSRLALAADVEVEWENGTIEWASNETFRRSPEGWAVGVEAARPEDLNAREFVSIGEDLDAIFAGVQPYDASGHYYVPVFGARDTRAVDLTLRAGYTFTPDLSLQFYSQLFVARARYDDFRILQDRDTRTPFDGFPKRNEFSRSSFQFNTVLRWEYRPGSVLFVVWTQERRGDDEMDPLAPFGRSPYERPFSSQISDTFGIFPGNVFLIKLSYTFLY